MTITANTITPDIEVTVEVEEVTPEQAKEWLENNNTHNRRIRKNQVSQLVRDMQHGQFLFTGDTVKFDWNDTLLDGQHRLAALVESGRSAMLVIVRGLDPRSQSAMDINSRRLAYDALRLKGVEGDMKNAPAIARSVFMYDFNQVPTHLETVQFVEEHEDDLADAVAVSEMIRRSGSKLTGGSFYGAAFYLLARIDRTAAHDFFEKLASGAELEKGSPILMLRNKLSNGLPFGFGRGAWHLRQNLSLVFYCWNAWRDGKELHQLRMPKEILEPK